jgi:hypothetical protein
VRGLRIFRPAHATCLNGGEHVIEYPSCQGILSGAPAPLMQEKNLRKIAHLRDTSCPSALLWCLQSILGGTKMRTRTMLLVVAMAASLVLGSGATLALSPVRDSASAQSDFTTHALKPDVSCPGPKSANFVGSRRVAQPFRALHNGKLKRAQVEIGASTGGTYLLDPGDTHDEGRTSDQ